MIHFDTLMCLFPLVKYIYSNILANENRDILTPKCVIDK